MEERQVTIAGATHPLPEPFIVLATQNPIEMEGTFPLPEAQVDRFTFKILIGYPERDELRRIAESTTGVNRARARGVVDAARVNAMREMVRRIPIASELIDAAVRLVRATRPDVAEATDETRRFVRFGASPRAAQALVLGAKAHALLGGRCHVAPADLTDAALPSMRHRVLLNFEAGAASVDADAVLRGVVERCLP
jgi:MoxR-like ATPase